MMRLRFTPSTNSMIRKYVSSRLLMSNTETMFVWFRRADSRASSRNISMKLSFCARCGSTRLIATFFLKP